MPTFLDTRGLTSVAIAVCDRCKMKRTFVSLQADPNFPGLRVCDQGCKDEFDPYRLPARKTERINLRFPRPDLSVAVDPDALLTNGPNNYEISTEGNTATPENNGNLDIIAPSP
jgi:hypothetical protein